MNVLQAATGAALATPFLGEIKLVSFNFAPKGWALCNGQLLPINQNQALFSLLGTNYGGDGKVNFALPNLQGRVAIHRGSGYTEGQAAGQASHTLTASELPGHSHTVLAAGADGSVVLAAGNALGNFNNGYGTPVSPVTLNAATISNAGGNQPHNNMSPFLVLNYAIALQGIFPSQT